MLTINVGRGAASRDKSRRPPQRSTVADFFPEGVRRTAYGMRSGTFLAPNLLPVQAMREKKVEKT